MKEELCQKLLTIKRTTVSLEQLEALVGDGTVSYESFAKVILDLESEGVLEIVKAQGRNGRMPSLAYRYRLKKHKLKEDHYSILRQYRLRFHPAIQLDAYYNLPPVQWHEDLPYLEKINHYLEQHGFPTKEVPAPERSMALVGDEKWITEKGGKHVLERIGIMDKLVIVPVSDPLMAAVNAHRLLNDKHIHLIVENKTTYQGLLPAIADTSFSTLIYGSGRKIIKSIEQFDLQFPFTDIANHTFYYFGDLDREGIAIWHGLQEKRPVVPALPFYRACLQKQRVPGKTNQRWNEAAIASFVAYFASEEQHQLDELFKSGYDYPQEVLHTEELQSIWRHSPWTTMTSMK